MQVSLYQVEVLSGVRSSEVARWSKRYGLRLGIPHARGQLTDGRTTQRFLVRGRCHVVSRAVRESSAVRAVVQLRGGWRRLPRATGTLGRHMGVMVVLLVRAFDPAAPSAGSVMRRWRRSWPRDGNIVWEHASPESAEVISIHPADDAERHAWYSRLDGDPEVYTVEIRPSLRLWNRFTVSVGQSGVSDSISNTSTPLWRRGLTGAGHVVGIADSGMDFDSCYFRHSVSDSAVPINACDLTRRKVACYFVLPWATAGDDLGNEGHGTHTSGSLAGLHIRTSETGDPSWENLLGGRLVQNGHAPGAKIVFHDIGSKDGFIISPVDLSAPSVLSEAYELGGARIHSNSWGCAEGNGVDCNGYDISTRSVDRFMWSNLDFLVVFAAGNYGIYGDRTGRSHSVFTSRVDRQSGLPE